MVRDKYRIDAFIATGSMANVYAATHRNGSRVALKILHRELARDPQMAERFKREGYFANAIGHAGVVRAIDDDTTEDGCAFIVLELLEGENLEDRRMRMGGKLSLTEAMTIGDAMLDVLSAAHKQEVLHRDVKPDNVFVTKKNEVKLLDFGVARFNDGRSSSDMTGVGMVLGTPAFMPPEQALGRREEVDARSDIWGVGATLFTIIAGEAVHAGGDAKTKLIATARKPARPLRDVAPNIPRAVASVIDRALAFDKIERWADANAMREALRWARMSINEEHRGGAPTQHSSGSSKKEQGSIAPPVETRRTPEDEPTLAGRSLRDAVNSFDDSTARRPPVQPQLHHNIKRHPTSISEVVTSAPPLKSDPLKSDAPPVTQRAARPPSMVPSEDPTFSLRNDPIFSLRRTPEDKPSPDTERLPHQQRAASSNASSNASSSNQETPHRKHQTDLPTIDRPIASTAIAAAAAAANLDKPWGSDAGDIFRAALANTAYAHDKLGETQQQHQHQAHQAQPRPAAGKHPDTSPSIRTNPGIGPLPGGLAREKNHRDEQNDYGADEEDRSTANGFAGAIDPNAKPPSQRNVNDAANVNIVQPNFAMTAPMPAIGVGLGAQLAQGHSPYAQQPPVQVQTYPPAPQQPYDQQPQQQQYDQQQYDQQQYDPQQQQYSSAPPAYAPDSGGGSNNSQRPSMTPSNPGPLLATIAPKRSGGVFRVLVPVLIGVLAGIGTYVVVIRQRAANASHPPAASAAADSAAAAASASASAATSASASALAAAGSAVPASPGGSSALTTSTTAPAPSASVAVIKKKRPRRVPAVPHSAASTSSAAGAASAAEPPATAEPTPPTPPTPPEPTTAPTPAPAPTPQDSLPRKEDN